MKYKYYYLIIFCFLYVTLFSCTNKDGYNEIFKKKQNVSLNLLENKYIYSLGRPEIIFFHKNNVFLADPIQSQLLFRYNAENDSISHLLSKGQGKNEIYKISNIGKGRTDGEIYISDIITRSVYFLSCKTEDIIKDSLVFPKQFCDVVYDQDKTFFLLVGDKKRFAIRVNNTIDYFGDNIELNGVNDKSVNKILQGSCVLSSVNKKIAQFSAYGDIFQIYDYNNIDNIGLVKSYKGIPPLYYKDDGAMHINTIFGIQSVITDDKHIYALYNGKTLKEMMNDKEVAFFSNKILVFNWFGEPVKQLILNQPIRSITYDETNNQILCLGLNKEGDNAIYCLSTI